VNHLTIDQAFHDSFNEQAITPGAINGDYNEHKTGHE